MWLTQTATRTVGWRSERDAEGEVELARGAADERPLQDRLHEPSAAAAAHLPEEGRAVGPLGPREEGVLAADADEHAGAALGGPGGLTLPGVAEAAREREAQPEGHLDRPDAPDRRADAARQVHEGRGARHERLVGVAADAGLEVDAPVRALTPLHETEPDAGGGDDPGPADLRAHARGGEDPVAHLGAEVAEPEVEAVDARVGRGVAARELLVVGDQHLVELALARVDQGLPRGVDLLVVVERRDVLPVEGDLLLQGAVARGEAVHRGALHRRAGEGADGPLLAGADVGGPRLLEAEAREALVADRDRDLGPRGARGPAGSLAVERAAGHVVAERRGRRALHLLREGGTAEREHEREGRGGGDLTGTDLHDDAPEW